MALSMDSICLGGYGYSLLPDIPHSCIVAPGVALGMVGYGCNTSACGCSSRVIGEVVALVVPHPGIAPRPGKPFGTVSI